jgi:hypothetical protein
MPREDIEPHTLQALLIKTKDPGGIVGKIHNPTRNIGAPVVNAYNHRPMIA